MKVKVRSEFIDRHTGKLHMTGEVMEVTPARYKEICRVDNNLVYEIPDDEPKTDEETAPVDTTPVQVDTETPESAPVDTTPENAPKKRKGRKTTT